MVESEGLLKFDHPKEQSSIIKVLGVGGGGSNAVNHMFRQGIHGVDFVICNTDAQAIETSPVPVKIQLGNSLTGGNGAGSKPEVGMNAAIENLEDIREVLSNDTRMVFITAGMGGGTGTGGAPVIARLAKEMGILTIGIVTIPFSFEGRKRRQLAENGIQELRKHVDTLLVINNDKLRELHGNLELWEAFAKADNILTDAARGIAEIITHIGYINVDFEDVKTVMKDSGVAIMGTGVASGENRAMLAVEDAMNSPLLNDNVITGASNVLLYISSGTKGIKLDEVTEITDYIQKEAGSNAEIIWGNGSDDSLGDNIAVTIIATGFNARQEFAAEAERRQTTGVVVGQLDPRPEKNPAAVTYEPMIQDIQMVSKPAPAQQDPIFGISTPQEPSDESYTPQSPEGSSTEMTLGIQQQKTTLNVAEPVINRNEYGDGQPQVRPAEKSPLDHDPVHQDRINRLRNIGTKINTPESLNHIETNPAYLRRKVKLSDPIPSEESQISKFTLNDGEEPNLSNNSFLHSTSD